MEDKLINYLPPVLQNIEELKVLFGAEDEEIKTLYIALENLMNDQFVHDATENGIKRWEQLLGIIPSINSTNLDVRRFEILNRLNIKIPYTMTMLRNKIMGMYGRGCSIKYVNDTFALDISIPSISDEEIENFQKMLDVIVPANLTWNIKINKSIKRERGILL